MGAIIPAVVIAFSFGPVVIIGLAVGFTSQQWALALVGIVAFFLLIVTLTRIGVRYVKSLGSILVIRDQLYEELAPRGGRGWGLKVPMNARHG